MAMYWIQNRNILLFRLLFLYLVFQMNGAYIIINIFKLKARDFQSYLQRDAHGTLQPGIHVVNRLYCDAPAIKLLNLRLVNPGVSYKYVLYLNKKAKHFSQEYVKYFYIRILFF